MTPLQQSAASLVLVLPQYQICKIHLLISQKGIQLILGKRLFSPDEAMNPFAPFLHCRSLLFMRHDEPREVYDPVIELKLAWIGNTVIPEPRKNPFVNAFDEAQPAPLIEVAQMRGRNLDAIIRIAFSQQFQLG